MSTTETDREFTVDIRIFGTTESEAIAWRDRYLSRWHPGGYETSFRALVAHIDYAGRFTRGRR